MTAPALAPRAKVFLPKFRYAVFAALAGPVLGALVWLATDNEKAALIVVAVAIFGGFLPLSIAYFALRGRAERRLFQTYAERRGLQFEPEGTQAHGVIDPELWVDYSASGSVDGEEVLLVRAIGANNTPPSYTFVFFDFEASAASFPALTCAPRSASEGFDRVEEHAGIHDFQHVYVESGAFNRRFELFAGPGQDPVDVHRLFSPSFVLWLTEAAPPRFGFEVRDGILTCAVQGHQRYRQSAIDSVEQMDAVVLASIGIVKRLREESMEASLGGT